MNLAARHQSRRPICPVEPVVPTSEHGRKISAIIQPLDWESQDTVSADPMDVLKKTAAEAAYAAIPNARLTLLSGFTTVRDVLEHVRFVMKEGTVFKRE